MSAATARPFELVSDEIEVQVRRIERVVKVLEGESRRLEHSGPVIAVPDTNVLLHYRPFEEVSWEEVIGAGSVLLAVPLRVVDELDEKKTSRSSGLASRAATVIAHLQRLLGDAAGAPVKVRKGVAIQVVRPPAIDEPYQPSSDADTEILDTCEALAFFTGKRVLVVSGDYGMRLRASARAIEAVEMPDRFRHLLEN